MDTTKLVGKLEEFFDLSKKKQRKKHDKLLKMIGNLEEKKAALAAAKKAAAAHGYSLEEITGGEPAAKPGRKPKKGPKTVSAPKIPLLPLYRNRNLCLR